MPPARAHAPLTARSLAELRALQRATLAVVTNPLARGQRTAPRLRDGRATRAVAATIAKPNDRLTAVERLEIYNRMYWFRVLDSVHEDCPGLRAVLGERRFRRLAEEFLIACPSRYWTLRDLPQRLARFIARRPELTRPHTALCVDVARFEWAQVQVFDGAARTPVTVAALAAADPRRLRLDLQPHLQLLALRHPADDFWLAVQRQDSLLRADASNAPTALRRSRALRARRPRPERCWVAVHRHEGRIFFKRLERGAYRVLERLRAGDPLARALAAAGPRVSAAQVQEWCATWMQLGWLCPRG